MTVLIAEQSTNSGYYQMGESVCRLIQFMLMKVEMDVVRWAHGHILE